MSETTARLALPLIVPGQAQKEMTHNEALARLDAAIQTGVESAGVNLPPADPLPGQCWIVGDDPGGAWEGRTRTIAAWTEGGWRFVAPRQGFRVWIISEGRDVRFLDGVWTGGPLTGSRLMLGGVEMLAATVPPVADPGGGTTIDTEARAAIAAILAALRHHNLVETP